MVTLTQFLCDAPWAQSLGSDERMHLAAETSERHIEAGGYLCRKGDTADCWIGVIDGLVKLQTTSRDGKALTFTGVPTGGWFGEGSLLKTEPRRYDAVALRASRVACMPRATFIWLYQSNIEFNHYLVLQLNERLGQFIGMVEYDRLLNLEARVARCLAMLYNPQLSPGIDTRLGISQEEIGFLSGITRPRVNRALHTLATAGLLRVEYGGITILDVKGLRNYGA
jgi:CRP-like cAMP-binding protein